MVKTFTSLNNLEVIQETDNRRVKLMKRLCKKYNEICYRDVQEYAIGVKPFYNIRDQFQIGYLPTLRYISFNRSQCVPSAEWIEGFIEAAKKGRKYYRAYRFMD